MDKFRGMTHFVAIVEEKSLTAAARRLRTSLPTVVRTLAALEAELAVRLMHRTTRRLTLTEEGRQYFEHCQVVLSQIAQAERALRGGPRASGGRLTLSASTSFGRAYVAPLLVGFAARHPDVAVELRLHNRVANLAEEGIDVAVRLGPLHNNSLHSAALVAVQVGQTPRVVCASPDYLARQGTPTRLEQLAQHACIRTIDAGAWKEWQFAAGGKPRRVKVNGPFDTNQLEVALEACAAGLGLGQFLGYEVRERLRRGELERVLQKFELPPLPVHVVCAPARAGAPRVRLLVDHLVSQLRQQAAAWCELDGGVAKLRAKRPQRRKSAA
jgi:DNA-binding transcriptional LysR family regulator